MLIITITIITSVGRGTTKSNADTFLHFLCRATRIRRRLRVFFLLQNRQSVVIAVDIFPLTYANYNTKAISVKANAHSIRAHWCVDPTKNRYNTYVILIITNIRYYSFLYNIHHNVDRQITIGVHLRNIWMTKTFKFVSLIFLQLFT